MMSFKCLWTPLILTLLMFWFVTYQVTQNNRSNWTSRNILTSKGCKTLSRIKINWWKLWIITIHWRINQMKLANIKLKSAVILDVWGNCAFVRILCINWGRMCLRFWEPFSHFLKLLLYQIYLILNSNK